MARTGRVATVSHSSSGRARFIIVRPSRLRCMAARHDHTGCRTPHGGSAAGGPGQMVTRNQVFAKNLVSQAAGGRSGRILRRPVEQLLDEYYQRGQYDQRLEREPEQWQREQRQ